MLDTLITSKTRLKLLLKFFLNAGSSSYLRNLETEFGESTNAIRIELNRFEKAGLLVAVSEGNKKIFKANEQHPLFSDIKSILRKYVGFDLIIETVIEKLGDVDEVYITGGFARGIDNQFVDLLFIGRDINIAYLEKLIGKAEQIISRNIRFQVLSNEQFSEKAKDLKGNNLLLLWKNP